MNVSTFGKHLIIDVHCSNVDMSYVDDIRDIMLECVAVTGATIIAMSFHQFTPIGVSGVILLAESHMTIHTFPEEKYAAIDMYTCGECNPSNCIEVIRHRFETDNLKITEFIRGV